MYLFILFGGNLPELIFLKLSIGFFVVVVFVFFQNPVFLYFYFLPDDRIQIPFKVGHHWPTSKAPFKWRFACVPMVVQHSMLAW